MRSKLSYSNEAVLLAYREGLNNSEIIDSDDPELIKRLEKTILECMKARSFRPLIEREEQLNSEMLKIEENYIRKHMPEVDWNDKDQVEQALPIAHDDAMDAYERSGGDKKMGDEFSMLSASLLALSLAQKQAVHKG